MLSIDIQFFGGRGTGGGKRSGGGASSSLKNSSKAAAVEKEISDLNKQRRTLVEEFAKAEDADNTQKMNSLRNQIESIDRDRKNADRRLRMYRYGEAF